MEIQFRRDIVQVAREGVDEALQQAIPDAATRNALVDSVMQAFDDRAVSFHYVGMPGRTTPPPKSAERYTP